MSSPRRTLTQKYHSSMIVGFTIIELMVGAVIFIGVVGAAYKLFTRSSQTAIESRKKTIESRELQQFFENYRQRVENTLQLPSVGYNPSTSSTVIQVKQPPTCVAAGAPGQYSWSIIPMPGQDVSMINTSSYTAMDPSAATVDTLTYGNDAVLFTSIPDDGLMNYMPLQHVSTIQNTAAKYMEAETADGLQVGDFAVVSDGVQRDLIRVTGIATGPCNANGALTCFQISHNYNTSVWNQKMSYDYGSTTGGSFGKPIIFKVNLETYALDSTTHQLMRDAHIYDDHFNPKTLAFGAKNLALKWEVVTPMVERFQIYYVSKYGKETRTPVAGIPGMDWQDYGCADGASCLCTNEIGLPNLTNIKTVVTFLKTSGQNNQTTAEDITQMFNPAGLKVGFGAAANASGGCSSSVPLYTTLSDGVTHNPACDNKACICSDRCPANNCNYNTVHHGGGNGHVKYGGGGSG